MEVDHLARNSLGVASPSKLKKSSRLETKNSDAVMTKLWKSSKNLRDLGIKLIESWLNLKVSQAHTA